MHLGNALICASTVLEYGCCRIHRYAAAPSFMLLPVKQAEEKNPRINRMCSKILGNVLFSLELYTDIKNKSNFPHI
jgi:hypothetical protein